MKRIAMLMMGSALAFALPASAQETRQLDAHEHGAGVLTIAMEHGHIAMELEAPGTDIVGFEYEAKSDADRKAIDTAIADLALPYDFFRFPASAGCTVTKAHVDLIGDAEHEHAEEEKHADGEEHGHDEHAHEEEHAEHHDEAAVAESHTEFHAEYLLDCTDPGAVDRIAFPYFEKFPNALELDVSIISDKGAKSFEVSRDVPELDLAGMI